MSPVKLDKEECVLISGSFTKEDIMALKDNPTLLSAKVSYIKNTVVSLYVDGYTTYVFTSDGLFDLMVANVINDLNSKGLTLMSVFVKPYPHFQRGKDTVVYPEEFSHITFCFSENKEDFRPSDLKEFLICSTGCVLSPSRIRNRNMYRVPAGMLQFYTSDIAFN